MKNVFRHIYLIPVLLGLSCTGPGQESSGVSDEANPDRNMAGIGVPRGLITTSEGLAPGYILHDVPNSALCYLISRKGEVLHEWKGDFRTLYSYLTDSGTVVRTTVDPDFPKFRGSGNGGRIQEINWEGDMIWNFEFATEDHLSHHDIALMPNGNVLAIAWEAKTKEEVLAAGRNTEFTPEAGLWPDMVVEIEPVRPTGGNIVWEWHIWDHLIQDIDPNLQNYGDPSQHPELLNVNASAEKPVPIHPDTLVVRKRRSMHRYRNTTIDSEAADVHHMNAIYYNADLDQIALSSYTLGEVFIIDHSTTTEEATGHSGGNLGKGGDFLYRWGNPQNYQIGDSTDQILFHQHDIRWIEDGKPGAGNLTVFNNDIPMGPDSLNYSAVLEIVPPKDAMGNYIVEKGKPFGPEAPVWTYTAPDTVSFFSDFVSGAHRMENGSTFIAAGAAGRSFEVTPEGEIVWEYWTPYRGKITNPDGSPRRLGYPSLLFRMTFIPADHPGLVSRDLLPLDPQPEVFILKSNK
jgi:hypothetical protein